MTSKRVEPVWGDRGGMDSQLEDLGITLDTCVVVFFFLLYFLLRLFRASSSPPTFYFISNSGNDKNKIKKPKASGRKKKMTVPVGRYEDECVLSRSLVCVAHYHSHTHTLPFDARFHRDFLFTLCLFSFLFFWNGSLYFPAPLCVCVCNTRIKPKAKRKK